MGRDKKWAFSGALSGVVVAMAARTASTRSTDENSLFVLLLCPFAHVSNFHCGFIRLFPTRRVEAFSSESFFGRLFGGDWHVLQNVLNPGEPCALWTFKFEYVTCGSKRSHAGPPLIWLLDIFDFFTWWYRKSRRASCCIKISKEKLVKWAT